MKIIKTAYQSPDSAHETAYIIKGVFKKRVYRIDVLGVVELPTYKEGKVNNEQTVA